MASCTIPGKWFPALPVSFKVGYHIFAYCCLTAKRWELGSLLQALSWKDLSAWYLRFFTYTLLCLRIHSYVNSLICCSHSGCEFGSVPGDHSFHLRWKKRKEVSFFLSSGIRQKHYNSTGRRGKKVRVTYVRSSFLLPEAC